MKKLIASLGIAFGSLVCCGAVQSGDVVVIGDMKYVVVSEGQFNKWVMTVQNMQAQIDAMNKTEKGREALHGRAGRATVTNNVVVVRYEDGYCVTNQIKTHAQERVRPTKTPLSKRSRRELPAQLEEIMSRRREAISHTNEVSVTIGE